MDWCKAEGCRSGLTEEATDEAIEPVLQKFLRCFVEGFKSAYSRNDTPAIGPTDFIHQDEEQWLHWSFFALI
jgi:hypothetical protein